MKFRVLHISDVTDEVIKDAKEWQSRPLDAFYAIVYLDALVINFKSIFIQ